MVNFNPLTWFKKKKLISVVFNSDDLTDNEKLQAVLNENAFLKGIIAKQKIEEEKKKEGSKEEEEEREIIRELTKEKKDLRKKEDLPFSLRKLFNSRNFRKGEIKLTTFDGKKDLGIMEDITIMPDGGLGIVSGGRIIWASNEINNVFYWIKGLNNFALKKIIPLCINSERQFTPNLMAEEIDDVVLTSDGKFKINRFNKVKMYEKVQDLIEESSDLCEELKVSESTITEQQKEIKEKDRESNLHKSRADKSDSGLSMALHKISEIEKASGEILKQNYTLMQIKEINEDLIDYMEAVTKKWGEKIKKHLGEDAEYNAWLDLKEKLDYAKKNMPQVIYQMPEKEEKPTLTEQFKPVKL